MQSKIVIFVLLAGCVLSACERDGAAQGSGSDQKIQGTLDPAVFYHPVIKRPEFLNIPGCCTLDIGSAKAERLNSDSQLMIVRGNDFEAEVVFGSNEVLEKPSNNKQNFTSVDGVIFAKLSTSVSKETRSTTWQARVPLTPSAEARGVVNPILKIYGKCRSDTACKIMEELVNSIRF